jgi:hypothetical protein
VLNCRLSYLAAFVLDPFASSLRAAQARPGIFSGDHFTPGAREGAKREVNGQSAEKTDAAIGPALTYLPSPRLGRSRPFSFAQAIAVS